MSTTFRTAPPPSYVSPEKRDMARAAGMYDTRGMAVDLIGDLAHMAAGGELVPPSHFRATVHQQVDAALPEPNQDGTWALPNNRFTIDRDEAVSTLAAAKMSYHTAVQDFVGSLDISRFPGETPLQQALSAVGLLGKMKGGTVTNNGTMPIFSDNTHPEGIARDMHAALDMADTLSDDEQSMLYPRGQQQGPMRKLQIAQDLVPGSDFRIMLEVSRQLDALSTLRARRDRHMEYDPEGDIVHRRPLNSAAEVINLPHDGWTLRNAAPHYWTYLAATQQLTVRERVSEIQRRQAILILADGSGSMAGSRHWKASGVVMNRLKAAKQGDAIVWVGIYDTQLYRVRQAETPEQARALMADFTAGNFGGGGTDTSAAIRAGHDFIQEQMKKGAALWKPDIVVLTDEDTSVSGITAADIPGTRVHGFAISTANPTLVNFARSTGGISMDNM